MEYWVIDCNISIGVPGCFVGIYQATRFSESRLKHAWGGFRKLRHTDGNWHHIAIPHDANACLLMKGSLVETMEYLKNSNHNKLLEVLVRSI